MNRRGFLTAIAAGIPFLRSISGRRNILEQCVERQRRVQELIIDSFRTEIYISDELEVRNTPLYSAEALRNFDRAFQKLEETCSG